MAAVNSSASLWNPSDRMMSIRPWRLNPGATTRTIRPGLVPMITTRSARNNASATECVTSIVVIRLSPPDPLELDVHVAPCDRIQSAERFVEQQYLGVECQRAGDGDALAHTAGKLLWPSIGEICEPNEFEQPSDLGVVHGVTGDMERKLQIGAHIEPGQQCMFLEGDADPVSTRKTLWRLAMDSDRTRTRQPRAPRSSVGA